MDEGQTAPAGARGGEAGDWRQKAGFLLVALAVLAFDQWTKWLVEVHLPHLASVKVIPGLLNFTHVRNTGVAFGLFASARGGDMHALALSLVGALALAVVLIYFWRTPAADQLLLSALALVLGGAVGNLADRLFRSPGFGEGAVVDFVRLGWWPTFNVADAAITVGIVILVLWALFASDDEEPAAT